MKNNPFASLLLHATAEPIERIREWRVDREDEVKFCTEAILDKAQNVLLYGERGVGKSFLVRLIQDNIEKEVPSVLPITVNMSGLAAYSPYDNASAFTRAVLIQLCAELWKKLLGKDYLDLRERLNEMGNEITFRSKPEKVIQRIYSNLMAYERKSRYEWFNSVGFSAGAKGEKRESGFIEKQQADILPFEFFEFIDAINSDVLAEYGKIRIVVLCDESNLLSIFSQHEILERYLELFAAKYVQFLFVAGFVTLENINNLPTSFEARLEIKGFNKRCFVEELIFKMNKGNEFIFLDDAVQVLYDCFRGHPRKTLEACSRALTNATEQNQSEVNALIMKLSCTELQQYNKELEKRFGNYLSGQKNQEKE